MIVVRLMGGLCNQVFQYALGRSLEARGKEVLFERGILNECSARIYLLDDFKTSIRFADKEYGTRIVENRMPFDPRVFTYDDCTLTGYWQSEKYFWNIANDLRKELVPRSLSPETLAIAREIENSNSVCLHIRRSDSLSARALPYHGLLCATPYYNRAVAYVQSRIPEAKFFVFSDDIPWCRANLNLDATFVGHNPMSGICDSAGIITKGFRGRECEDLWLMSQCQHAILANSSFGWFGAWLGDNKADRIVIAPRQWFIDPQMDSRDIVPLRWMTL